MPAALQIDPTRLGLLRRRFLADMNRRFADLKAAVIELVVVEDAFGLKTPDTSIRQALRTNERWRFATDDQKVQQYQQWFQQQVDEGLLSVDGSGDPWTADYVHSAYRQGVIRSYTDARPSLDDEQFGDGSRAEFLRSAFNQPEAVSKLRLLSLRSFEQLRGMSSQMAASMNRVLANGLASGYGARRMARDLVHQLDGGSVGRKRALTIARTELVHAHAEGQLDSLEKLGVKELGLQVEWQTAGDPCKQCSALAGTVWTLERARGMLPRHPNCRCAWVPANVSESTKGQKRGKAATEAIEESVQSERPNASFKDARELSRWSGADLTRKIRARANRRRTAKKIGAPAPNLFNEQPTAVLRWMGKEGWTFEEARKALNARGVPVADATIRAQLLAGRKGTRGAPANLTPEQANLLREARDSGSVVPPVKPPKPPVKPPPPQPPTPPLPPNPVVPPPQPTATVDPLPGLKMRKKNPEHPTIDDFLKHANVRQELAETIAEANAIRRHHGLVDLKEDDYELRLVPLDRVTPSQTGEDYINSSSKSFVKHIRKFNSSERINDYRPIVVDEQFKIVDGNHRHAAHTLDGQKYIPVLVPKNAGVRANPNIPDVDATPIPRPRTTGVVKPKHITYSGEVDDFTERVWKEIGEDGITSHEHASRVGRVIADEVNNSKGFKEAQANIQRLKEKVSDLEKRAAPHFGRVLEQYPSVEEFRAGRALMTEMNMATSDLRVAQKGLNKVKGEEFRKAVKRVRDVGGVRLTDVVGGKDYLKEALQEGAEYLPSDWIRTVDKKTKFTMKETSRGYFHPKGGGYVETSGQRKRRLEAEAQGTYQRLPADISIGAGRLDRGKHVTATHELVHAYEYVDPRMAKYARQHLESRLKPGERATSIYKKADREYGYEDEFLNHYIGRTYGDTAVHTEIMSMGSELLHGMDYAVEDERLASFVLGMLVGL